MPTPKPATDDVPDHGARVNVHAEMRRTHAGILLFYGIDALLLGALAAAGTVPPTLALWYALAGCTTTELIFFWFNRRGRRIADLESASLALTATTGLVMLATLGAAPQVGGLMLMSMMAVLSLSATQLSRRHQLTLCLLLGAGSVAVLAFTGGRVGVPTASAVECALSAVWLVWLMAKVSAHNIAGTRLRDRLTRANAELARALQALEQVAATDELTRLPNRRSILAGVQRAVVAEQQSGGPVGIALLDIDRFKLINDSRGHAVGDQVLREFGRIVALGLRPSDQVGRYGGEEFLLVLQKFDDAGAAADVVQRLCSGIGAHDWSDIAPGLAVTASAGVTLLMPGEDSAAAIRRADAALYQAKEQGRNRVVAATPPPVAGAAPERSAAARV